MGNTKNYYFLAGLPRSGNTLMSAILNQNPEIYVSPLSPLPSVIWEHEQNIMKEENFLRVDHFNKKENMMKNFIPNYYYDIDKPNIIVREKAWGTPANLDLLKKYVNPNPKIIFTIRPVLDILTSFINILPEESHIDLDMKKNWWYKDYLTKNENRCDFLMSAFGLMDKSLLTLNSIINPENKNMFCLIKYDDLINEPEKTMTKIYKFLELPSYTHDFNNIIKIEKDNDKGLNHPEKMHEVRKELKKNSKNPKDVLSKYTIDKYSNIGWDLK